MNASTPRMKSRVSRTFSTVALVGAPSLNSSVPMRVSTLSGVTSDGGIAAGVWAVAFIPPLQSAVAKIVVDRISLLRFGFIRGDGFGSLLRATVSFAGGFAGDLVGDGPHVSRNR